MVIPYHTLFHVLLYNAAYSNAPDRNEALGQFDYHSTVVPTLAGARAAACSDMATGCCLLAIDGADPGAVERWSRPRLTATSGRPRRPRWKRPRCSAPTVAISS